MRACAIEMDMRNSKSNFYASRPTQHAAPTRANPDLNPLNSYRKNPLVRSTIWGKTKNERDPGEERLDRRHRSELFLFFTGTFWSELVVFWFFLGVSFTFRSYFAFAIVYISLPSQKPAFLQTTPPPMATPSVLEIAEYRRDNPDVGPTEVRFRNPVPGRNE